MKSRFIWHGDFCRQAAITPIGHSCGAPFIFVLLFSFKLRSKSNLYTEKPDITGSMQANPLLRCLLCACCVELLKTKKTLFSECLS